jgi:DNA-binding HxlR family transcriptional regulator
MSTNEALNIKLTNVQVRLAHMENEKDIEKDRQRAEVFDALGHPTRIAILKALNEGAIGFAELKKKTAIESSGHLQHHLNKLDGLIKTDEYGKYCLSDQGKDALVTAQTVENASVIKETPIKTHRSKSKTGLKSVAMLLTALLLVSSAFAVFEYSQIAALQKDFDRINGLNFDAMAYYNEFGLIPNTNVNSSFAPPVSMYRALQIALETDGWNRTSLNGMTVGAYFYSWQTVTDYDVYKQNLPMTISPTTPPSDYSDVYGNGVIYSYVWEIVVQNASQPNVHPPIGFSVVDVSTGQILPNPPMY